MPLAIRVDHLSHRYPKATAPALNRVSLSVEAGEMFALLGPNGGGKSTLFRILATLLRPGNDQGDSTIQVAGEDVRTNPTAVRRELGIVFQNPSLDELLTVWENVVVAAAMYGLSGREVRERGEAWLKRFELWDRRDARAGDLSGGMKRRLEIAKTMLHEPSVLLLDEPTTGLDPTARRQFWRDLQAVRAQRRETDGKAMTVVVTTHLLEEAEPCDRVGIIDQGEIVAIDTPAALIAQIGGDVVTLTVRDADRAAALCDTLQQRGEPWAAGTQPRRVDQTIRFEHERGASAIAQFADMLEGQVDEIRVSRPTLEDVFARLTGRQMNDQDRQAAN